MSCYHSRIFTINAYKRGQECNTKTYILIPALLPQNQISHLLRFTGMSWRVRSAETTL